MQNRLLCKYIMLKSLAKVCGHLNFIMLMYNILTTLLEYLAGSIKLKPPIHDMCVQLLFGYYNSRDHTAVVQT